MELNKREATYSALSAHNSSCIHSIHFECCSLTNEIACGAYSLGWRELPEMTAESGQRAIQHILYMYLRIARRVRKITSSICIPESLIEEEWKKKD